MYCLQTFSQIFYDLGAGCGKAVVAAALSNRVRFLKTVGIELLPSLCFCASAVVSAISSQAGVHKLPLDSKFCIYAIHTYTSCSSS